MITKKILSLAASITKLFIFLVFLSSNSNAEENNSKYYSDDLGTISLMYHRFNEDKYPSTNIEMDIFKKQINIIRGKNYSFENPKDFDLIVGSVPGFMGYKMMKDVIEAGKKIVDIS